MHPGDPEQENKTEPQPAPRPPVLRYEFTTFFRWFAGLFLPPVALIGTLFVLMNFGYLLEGKGKVFAIIVYAPVGIAGYFVAKGMLFFWLQMALFVASLMAVRWWAGCARVERAIWGRRVTRLRICALPLFLVPALFLTPGIVAVWLVAAAYAFVHSVQMAVWSVRAATSVDCPEHLVSIRPRRMQIGAFLLTLTLSFSIFLVLLGGRGYQAINQSNMHKAVSEINNAELAMMKMLPDADMNTFGSFLRVSASSQSLTFDSLAAAEAFYTKTLYDLLRNGKNATLPELDPGVLKKLGTGYMDLDDDPWGQPYRFFFGPLKETGNQLRLPDGTSIEYVMPFRMYGPQGPMPAATKLPLYIYSTGLDRISAQAIDAEWGGSDDISNWVPGECWRDRYGDALSAPFKLRWRTRLPFMKVQETP